MNMKSHLNHWQEGGGVRGRRNACTRLSRLVLLATVAALPIARANAQVASVPTIVSGATLTGTNGTITTITQNANRAVVEWTNGLTVPAGSTLNFAQPDAASVILNQVSGGAPTSIDGSIVANGQVWILNSSGMIIGSEGSINTKGFLFSSGSPIGTALDPNSTDSYASDNYQLFLNGSTKIRVNIAKVATSAPPIDNNGNITADSEGYVVFLGRQMSNAGTITAPSGSVILTAGTSDSFVDFVGDGLITFGLGANTGQLGGGSVITNSGAIIADGGKVQIKVNYPFAAEVIGGVINTTGLVQARSVNSRNGQIVLDAGTGGPTTPTRMVVGGTLDTSGLQVAASANNPNNGSITVNAKKILLDGNTVWNAGGSIVAVGGTIGLFDTSSTPNFRMSASAPTAPLMLGEIDLIGGSLILDLPNGNSDVSLAQKIVADEFLKSGSGTLRLLGQTAGESLNSLTNIDISGGRLVLEAAAGLNSSEITFCPGSCLGASPVLEIFTNDASSVFNGTLDVLGDGVLEIAGATDWTLGTNFDGFGSSKLQIIQPDANGSLTITGRVGDSTRLGDVNVFTAGQLTLGVASAIRTTGDIKLAATGGFQNLSISSLVLDSSLGRWIVWSGNSDPENATTGDNFGSLMADDVFIASPLIQVEDQAQNAMGNLAFFEAGAPFTVADGTATYAATGTLATITQTTNRAVLDWANGLNVSEGSTLTFAQPDSTSITLNRVTSNTPSLIDGTVTANGQVWILNGAGLIVGPTGQINTKGFLFSTAGLLDFSSFMDGSDPFYDFVGATDNSIVNRGEITAGDGGYVVLAGGQVINSPTLAGVGSASIVADGGTVAVGGGGAFSLDLADGPGLPLFSVTASSNLSGSLTQPAFVSSIFNTGAIRADGGRVILQVRNDQDSVLGVINTSGLIQAQTANGRNGEILIDAGSADRAIVAGGTWDTSGQLLDVSSSNPFDGSLTVNGSVALQGDTTIRASGALNVRDTITSVSDAPGGSTFTATDVGLTLTGPSITVPEGNFYAAVALGYVSEAQSLSVTANFTPGLEATDDALIGTLSTIPIFLDPGVTPLDGFSLAAGELFAVQVGREGARSGPASSVTISEPSIPLSRLGIQAFEVQVDGTSETFTRLLSPHDLVLAAGTLNVDLDNITLGTGSLTVEGPVDPFTVADGTATYAATGTLATITQTTNRAVLDWANGLNVSEGSTLTFAQPDSTSITLNRVTSNTPSLIDGTVTANGQVWILNGAGLIVGPTGQINTKGFLFSTAGLLNDDFASFMGASSTSFGFAGDIPNQIVNHGQVTSADGGYVVIAGQRISNAFGATITANKGTVALGVGSAFSVDFVGDGLVGFTPTTAASISDSAITNAGTITAHGGRVIMNALTVNDIIEGVINSSGVVEAQSAFDRNGQILLNAGLDRTILVSGTLDTSGLLTATSASNPNDGSITLNSNILLSGNAFWKSSGATSVSGNINTAGGGAVGGSVVFNTESFTITGGDADELDAISGSTFIEGTSPLDIALTGNWSYSTSDDGPNYDPAFYFINGDSFDLTDPNASNMQSGLLSLDLISGDIFGFYINNTDGCCGAGNLTISNLSEPFGAFNFVAGEQLGQVANSALFNETAFGLEISAIGLEISAKSLNTSSINLDTGTLTVNVSDQIETSVISGTVTAGVIQKDGAGILRLQGQGNQIEEIRANQGLLSISVATDIAGSAFRLNGGILQLAAEQNVDLTGPIAVDDDSVLQFSGTNNWTLANVVTSANESNLVIDQPDGGSLGIFGQIGTAGTELGALTVFTNGQLTLDGEVSIKTTGIISLATSSGFANFSAAQTVLDPGLSRWFIWSGNTLPFDGKSPDLVGNLAHDFRLYDVSLPQLQTAFGTSDLNSILPDGATGNGLIYSLNPSLTGIISGDAVKIYDGTDTAPIANLQANLTGAVNNDLVSLASARFNHADVLGAQLSQDGLVFSATDLSGKPVFGYGVNGVEFTATGTITPASLTVTGLSAVGRAYNASTEIALVGAGSLVGLIGDETLDLGGTTTAALSSPDAGERSVTTDLTLANGLNGGLATNYALVQPTLDLVTITPAALTVTGLSALGRSYNATSEIELTGGGVLEGLFGEQTLVLGGATTGLLSSPDAGERSVTTDLTLANGLNGGLATNYALVQPTLDLVTITPAALTVTGLSALGRSYNATSEIELTGGGVLEGLFGEQTLVLGGATTGLLSSPDAGERSVTTDLTLANGLNGGLATNYALVQPTLDLVTITPAALTVTGLSALGRSYNATSEIELTGGGVLEGLFGEQTLVLGGATTGLLSSPDAGERSVTTDLTLANGLNGGLATNYALVQPTLDLVTITPAALTVTGLSALGRSYNATSEIELTGGGVLEGLFGEQTLVLGGATTGLLSSPDAGERSVTTDLTLANGLNGGLATNYALVQPTLDLVTITPAALTVTGLSALGRSYNATSEIELTGGGVLEGLFGEQTLVLGGATTGLLSSPDAGERSVTTDLTLANGLNGGLATNYALVQPTLDLVTITPAALTVTGLSALGRSYNATSEIELTGGGVLEGLFGEQTLVLGGATTGLLSSPDAGERSVTTDLTLANGLNGGLATNYALVQPTLDLVTITPAALTVTGLSALGRSYNATSEIELTGGGVLEGLFGEQTLVLGGATTGLLSSPDAGERSVTTDLTLANGLNGGLATNYALVQPTLDLVTITPAALTVTGLSALGRSYNATSEIELTGGGVLEGLFGEQTLVLGGATTGLLSSPDAGERSVTTDLTLANGLNGGLATNYALVQPTLDLVTITQLTLTYVATPAKRGTGEANPPFTGSLTGFISGDSLATQTVGTIRFESPATTGSPAGLYPILGTGLTAKNYVFEQASANSEALTLTSNARINSTTNAVLNTVSSTGAPPVVTPVIAAPAPPSAANPAPAPVPNAPATKAPAPEPAGQEPPAKEPAGKEPAGKEPESKGPESDGPGGEEPAQGGKEEGNGPAKDGPASPGPEGRSAPPPEAPAQGASTGESGGESAPADSVKIGAPTVVVTAEPVSPTPPSPVGSEPEKVPEDFEDGQDPILQLASGGAKSVLIALSANANVERVSPDISIDRTPPILPLANIEQPSKFSIGIDLF
ncbi:MAG: YDG domain-containing protein [Polymorphobacter sp.]|uniref:YDG domain-containing protein n=1 Tax=Polymorphobacter sp. TaxID=1909290 RepID=UPI003A8C4F8E